MFALWYAALTYKEYKDAIWEKLLPKKQTSSSAKETAVVCPLPSKRSQPEPPAPSTPPKPSTPSTGSSSSSSPQTPPTPIATSTPTKRSPEQPKPLEPPAKPPRSPSPHPIKAETLDDIEYEDEDEEVEEDGSEVEEDDENSVISSSPRRNQTASAVDEFIGHEINQPNSLRLNQTR